jgi:hypothetical protein
MAPRLKTMTGVGVFEVEARDGDGNPTAIGRYKSEPPSAFKVADDMRMPKSRLRERIFLKAREQKRLEILYYLPMILQRRRRLQEERDREATEKMTEIVEVESNHNTESTELTVVEPEKNEMLVEAEAPAEMQPYVVVYDGLDTTFYLYLFLAVFLFVMASFPNFRNSVIEFCIAKSGIESGCPALLRFGFQFWGAVVGTIWILWKWNDVVDFVKCSLQGLLMHTRGEKVYAIQ